MTSGSGTLITGGTIVNGRRSPADSEVTTILNGPSCNGTMVGYSSRVINVGDIIVIPEGVPHGFSAIPDHVTYLSVRPDLKKVLKKGYVNPALAARQRTAGRHDGSRCDSRDAPADVRSRSRLAEGTCAMEARRRLELRGRRAGSRLGAAPATDAVKPEDAPKRAPAVMVFERRRQLHQGWGGDGAGYEWPQREHGIHIDNKGFVWITGNNCPTNGIANLKHVADDQILKFTQDGKFVMQIGHSNQSKGNADTQNVHRAADVQVYPRDQRAVRRRRLRQPPRRSCSTPTAASSSGCGARSATSRWTTTTAKS